jgi:plasmid maintenance system killer protein
MDILFKDKKLQKECNRGNLLQKRFGHTRAKLIALRLSQLQAAEVLEDIRILPQIRCHELKLNRKGQLAVDLEHPYRLIIEPADAPVPRRPDGGLDWTQVKKLQLLG